MYILNFYIAIQVSGYMLTYVMLVNYYPPAETNTGPLVLCVKKILQIFSQGKEIGIHEK